MANKVAQQGGTVADAISIGFGGLQSLRDDVGEVVEGAEGTPRENTGRIQTLGETRDALNNVADDEPDNVPEAWQGITVTWPEEVSKRGLSRASQCANAVAALQAASAALQDVVDEGGLSDEDNETLEEIIGKITEAVDAAEGCEFPGMFG